MKIRTVRPEDTEAFFEMLCQLDDETDHMMYEPGERIAKTTDLSRLQRKTEAAARGESFLVISLNDAGKITGFLSAEYGKLNRVRHSAYVVIGILKESRNQGVGTEFFRLLEEWAKANQVRRLELSVECENTAALHLYEKCGFSIEGIRKMSMLVNGTYRDEYYMSRIL